MLRAGLTAFALLSLSRILGLLRESIQAATLGATSVADSSIIVLTVPDLLSAIVVLSGARLVLLPRWSGYQPHAVHRDFLNFQMRMLWIGLAMAAVLIACRGWAADALAPGLQGAGRDVVLTGLIYAFVAIPLTFHSSVLTLRLNHERDFVAIYLANSIVNIVIIAGLFLLYVGVGGAGTTLPAIDFLGITLLAAALLRIIWLRSRLPAPAAAPSDAVEPAKSDDTTLWLWAIASGALPLLLPIIGRSFASVGGEGYLALYAYAWKLVELPQLLLLQVVATVYFPSIARSFSAADVPQQVQLAKQALALCWMLSCCVIAAIMVAPNSVATLVYGWGRMSADSTATIGSWLSIGIWALAPQALIGILTLTLASRRRLAVLTLAYALGAIATAVSGFLLDVSWVLASPLIGFAVVAAILSWQERALLRRCLSVRDVVPPLGAVLAVWALSDVLPAQSLGTSIVMAVLAALLVALVSLACSRSLRNVLRDGH